MYRARRSEEGLPPKTIEFPDVEIDALVGKTLTSIWLSADRDVLGFACSDGEHYALGHDQDCCETVVLEEIVGDIHDLVAPILMAEKSTEDKSDELGAESWTFYKLATGKGYVTLRWCGRSSSEYSTEVSFKRVK